MAAHASSVATTDINKQVEQQQDNTRMAFVAYALPTPAPVPASSLPQQKCQPEQCNAKILQALLGIVTNPQVEKEMEEADLGAEEEQQKQQQQSHMELSQIELIYRAEGNANLVLALPQFKKLLRLPKTPTLPSSSHSSSSIKYNKMKIDNTLQEEQQQLELKVDVADSRQVAGEEWQQQCPEQQQTQEWQLQRQQKQHEMVQSVSDPAVNQNANDLTMEDFVAYIEVIRNLIGSEYVFETEIIRIAKEEDIRWINERIRADRPAHRRDKEFCGEFGLLLPDATRLPIAFDILLTNLQAKLIGDTYAIEIKPKQGWLLPSAIIKDLLNQKSPTHASTIPATAPATPEVQMVAAALAEKSKEMKATCNSHITRCRYCAMQFLKLRAGKINRRSSYCPIALFSGIHSEMSAAIDALLQCPQNNLRIFCNGILIYDGDKHSYNDLVENIFSDDQIQLLKDLVVACLLKDYTANTSNNNSKKYSSSDLNGDDATDVGGIAKAAAGQPHLNSIPSRRTQPKGKFEREEFKESNVMPTNRAESTRTTTKAAAAKITTKSLPSTTTTTTAKPTSTTRMTASLDTIPQAQITDVEMLCLPKNCVLQKILHLQLLAKHHMTALQAAGYTHKSEKSYNALRALLKRSYNEPLKMELESFEAYLLGATALDCSIMLAFQEISVYNQEKERLQSTCLSQSPLSKHCVPMPRYNKTFLTKITLVDLDPKPDSHLCKYIKQTCQALSLFMDNGT